MKIINPIMYLLKPWLPIAAVLIALQMTGQLGKVTSAGQTALLKTGLFNAGTESENEDFFDYNFTAYALDGKTLNVDSLKNKVVFLNIWATWCGPCRAEMPTIQNLYNDIGKTDVAFVILSVDRNDSKKKVKQYIDNSRYTFPVYILEGQPTEQLRVPTIPTTLIISKKGKIIRVENGMTNYDTEKFRKFLIREAKR